jgi:hypothetical protein
MNHRTMEFFVKEKGRGLDKTANHQYLISIHWGEETKPRGVSLTIVRGQRDTGVGWAFCAPDDAYDIRVGVPLALKRALHQIKDSNRSAVKREFFRLWPEAHPGYRVPKFRIGSVIDVPTQNSLVRIGDQIIVDGRLAGKIG